MAQSRYSRQGRIIGAGARCAARGSCTTGVLCTANLGLVQTMPAIENEYVKSRQKNCNSRICPQCRLEKTLKCFKNGKGYTRLCHSCRNHNSYKKRTTENDGFHKCYHCAYLAECQVNVYLGKRLPCQPEQEYDIVNYRKEL